ncbi:hypothetical protein JCM5296_001495 [Sporobolomyces johnsonii]
MDHPAPPQAGPPTYTIVLRGKRFVLSASQISFDSPNYFTAAFLGGFKETATRTIYSDRRPEYFAVIFEHLAGYDVFPVKLEGLSEEEGAKAILAEAEYFQLDGLADKAKEALDGLADKAQEALGRIQLPHLWADGGVLSFVPQVHSFNELCRGGSLNGQSGRDVVHAVRRPDEPPPLLHFQDLQIELYEPDSEFSMITFLDPLERMTVRGWAGLGTNSVHLHPDNSEAPQVTVSVDGVVLSLPTLVSWASRTSPQAAFLRALQPLEAIFNLNIVPSSAPNPTLRVSSANGYWVSEDCIRLFHMTIKSKDQGYARLDPGY